MEATSEIRHILVATDFSSDSERALEWAIRWARWLDADVEIFHAVSGSESGGRDGVVPSNGESDRRGSPSRKQALDSLQSILGRMSAAGVLASADLTHGPASVEIVKRAAESRAHLVVMGRGGRSRSERADFGSVAARVLRQIKTSVLLAPS